MEPPKYRRIVELGRGGMALVSLTAMRSSHGVTKLVVVKELQANLAADAEYRAMFLDEARLAARLNHPNVVQTFEIVDHVGAEATDGLSGVCALIMEWLEGQPMNRLRARMKDDPRALGVYVAVMAEALSGIDYAHNLVDYQGQPLGIVHRDISPHNIFVTYSGEVKVVDFGIAKANDSGSAPTQVGTVKGKLAYMAPEQARGDRVDARADVFACGVILWEAAVGRRLWAGMNDAGIMYKLSQADIPAPRAIKHDVPEALDAIVRRALAFNPDDRYPTAAALRDDLETFALTLAGKPSRRALGEIVSQLFTAERAQVRRIVEEQLGRASAASTDQFSAPEHSLPKLPSPKESSSAIQGLPSSGSGSTRVNAASSVMPPPRSRAGMVAGIAGAAVVVLAIVAIVLAVRPWQTAAAPAATTQAVAPSATPIATGPTRRVLAIDPPSARATLDGSAIASGTKAIEGKTPMTLHVEADGYAPADVRVVFDTNDPIVVRLAQLPPSQKSTATHPTSVAGNAHVVPTTKPTGTSRPTSSPTDVGY
jgi:serine/threonine-protein kinase